jgi:hypothetical protein
MMQTVYLVLGVACVMLLCLVLDCLESEDSS